MSRAFFFDASESTSKTITIRTIQALLHLRERKVIALANSAVAASLLDGGRTADSLFKIPIPCYEDSVCRMLMDSAIVADIRKPDLII